MNISAGPADQMLTMAQGADFRSVAGFFTNFFYWLLFTGLSSRALDRMFLAETAFYYTYNSGCRDLKSNPVMGQRKSLSAFF